MCAASFLAVIPMVALVCAAPQRATPPAPGTAPSGVPATKLPPPLAAETMAFVLPAAEEARVRATVEQVVGRTLTRAVSVQVAEPTLMGEAILRSMKATSPDGVFDPRQVEQLAQRQVALYDVATQTIFIGSGGLAAIGESERGPVARMMLAQATVQAIVDQEIGTAAYMSGEGPEIAVARRMVSEGFAVTARDRAAVRLGLDPNSPGYRPHLPGAFDTTDERSALERTIYGTGRTVVECRWNAKGIDSVWSMLASKPTSVRELAMAIPRSRALRVLQSVMDTALATKEWRRGRAPTAPSVSLAALKGPTAAERDALVAGCLGVDTLGYSNVRGGGAVLFSSVRGKDEAATKALADAISRVPAFLQADFERQMIRVKVTPSTFEVNGVTVRLTSVEPAEEGGDVPPTRIYQLVAGDEVLSLTLTNARLTNETIEKAIQVAAQELGKPAERLSPTGDEAQPAK